MRRTVFLDTHQRETISYHPPACPGRCENIMFDAIPAGLDTLFSPGTTGAAAAAAAALLANKFVASGGGRCLLGGRCRYVPIPPALDPLGGIDAFSLAP